MFGYAATFHKSNLLTIHGGTFGEFNQTIGVNIHRLSISSEGEVKASSIFIYISLRLGFSLKFMMSGPPGTELFISSDMFFLEVLLEPTGVVKDVKIHHEGKNEQQV